MLGMNRKRKKKRRIMKKFVLMLFMTVFAVAWTKAENYPYRSDYLWVTVPNHNDWLYKTGEKALVSVQLYKYGMPVSCEAKYEIADDMLAADKKGKVSIKNGKCEIDLGTRKTPGFRDLAITATVGGKQ